MSELQTVRCSACVDRPYESVKAALHHLPIAGEATLAGHVSAVCDHHDCAGLPPLTRVALGWAAADVGASDPVMSAEIYASAMSPTQTQLEIEGHCRGRRPGDQPNASCPGEDRLRAILDGVVAHLRRDIGP